MQDNYSRNTLDSKGQKMLIGKFSEYKGHTGSIEYDYESYRYCGKVLDVEDDRLLYEANSVEELYGEYKSVVDFYMKNLESGEAEDEI